MMGSGMMHGMHWGMGWMMLCAFFGVILLIGIVLLILWAIKIPGKNRTDKAEETALDILKKRYASGEISREEYEKMKQDIS
jgi:putative membrane protein